MGAAKCKVKRLADTYARCPDAGEGEEQTLMALVTTEKMLKDAQAGHYAVGAFNVENLEFVMAVLAAAEETKSPVIMQTTPGTIKTAGLDYFYGMVKAAAERASVPVALHLDHGDGYDRCMQAFRTGYTSVMIDGSHEPFEDNIALTKSVADAGRAMGVPVEAELGKVGGKEDDGPAVEGESPYTDPAEAKEFVERTGCTSLAIGVGTSHGVYTSDPRVVPEAKKLDEITYNEMLELASLGAQVLHNRSVELAKSYNIQLEVLSSFVEAPGTIVKEVVKKVEKTYITGVAQDKKIARIALVGMADEPGVAYKLFNLLAKEKVNVDMILQSLGHDEEKDIVFTLADKDVVRCASLLDENKDSLHFDHMDIDTSVSKVSIVGAGMLGNPGVAAKAFEALYQEHINIHMISTSEIKLSVLIDKADSDRAVRVIHNQFFQ